MDKDNREGHSTAVTLTSLAAVVLAAASLVVTAVYVAMTAKGHAMLEPPLNVAIFTMLGLSTGVAVVARYFNQIRRDLAEMRSEMRRELVGLARRVEDTTKPIVYPRIVATAAVATGKIHRDETDPHGYAAGYEAGLQAKKPIEAKVLRIDRH